MKSHIGFDKESVTQGIREIADHLKSGKPLLTAAESHKELPIVTGKDMNAVSQEDRLNALLAIALKRDSKYTHAGRIWIMAAAMQQHDITIG